jgi:flagellar FliJ protein
MVQLAKRSERIGLVQRMAGEKADTAARRLAERREQQEQEQERLAQLRGFRREYEQKLAVSGQNGIDAYRLRDYNAFLARIDRAIAEQRTTVERIAREVEQLRENWLAQWGNARALEQLVTRYRHRERGEAEAREQRRNDELAQRPAGRGPGSDD